MIDGRKFPANGVTDGTAYRWEQRDVATTWAVWYYTGEPFSWYIYYHCDYDDGTSMFVDLPRNWILTS